MENKSNMQVKQSGLEDSPAEGGEGYVGGNPNASTLGFDYVTGKKGSVTDKPIWSQETPSTTGDSQNIHGGSEPSPVGNPAGSYSTDEKASWKKVQTDEGLPQTFMTSKGAGDAGPTGSDEPDTRGVNEINPDTQDVSEGETSDMPQTEFTHKGGSGAPDFKHSGS